MLPILEYTNFLRKLGSTKKTNAVFGAFSGARGIHGGSLHIGAPGVLGSELGPQSCGLRLSLVSS